MKQNTKPGCKNPSACLAMGAGLCRACNLSHLHKQPAFAAQHVERSRAAVKDNAGFRAQMTPAMPGTKCSAVANEVVNTKKTYMQIATENGMSEGKVYVIAKAFGVGRRRKSEGARP